MRVKEAIQRERADMLHRMETAISMEQDSHCKTVLTAQADMIRQGLHERNLEEVPDYMGDVARFHENFGLEYLGKPRMLPTALEDFRHKFHMEEINEYHDEQAKLEDAVKRSDDRDITNSLELQLDALCDAMYVILGTAYLQFGPKIFNAAWVRVQAANMKKERAIADEDARSKRDTAFDVVKPMGWVAPDHRDLVSDHAHKIYRHGGELNAETRSDTQIARDNRSAEFQGHNS